VIAWRCFMLHAHLLSLALLLALVPTRAMADPPPRIAVRLEYTRGPGTESCPDTPALHDAIVTQLGYDPVRPDADARLVALLARQGQGLRASLVLLNPAGRSLWADEIRSRGADCSRLIDSMALAIRVGIDPLVLPPPAPAPPPIAPPPPLISPPAAPAPAQDAAPPKPSSTRPKIRVGLGTSLSVWSAPALAASFSLQAGVRWDLFSISAEGRTDLPATGKKEGIVTSLTSGALLPCVHPAGIVLVCGLVTAGARRFSTMDDTSHGSAFFAGAGVRAGVEIPIAGPLSVRASGDFMGTIQPTIARVDGVERWTSPPVSAGFGVGVLGNF
jgi:hypothetical protein